MYKIKVIAVNEIQILRIPTKHKLSEIELRNRAIARGQSFRENTIK